MATAASKTSKSSFDFEKSLKEIESIQKKLEDGDLSLEESLRQFEKGSKLIKECRVALEKAEQRVQILTGEDGKLDSFKDQD